MKKLFVFCLFIARSVFGQNVDSLLVAYYPFSGNAHDSSGNGYHGLICGNVIDTVDRFGQSNSAYYFDGGETSYIKVLNPPLINTFSELSISLWFNKIDPVNYSAGFINKQRFCGICNIPPIFDFKQKIIRIERL